MRKIGRFLITVAIIVTIGLITVKAQVEGTAVIGKKSNGCSGLGICSIDIEKSGAKVFEYNVTKGAENAVKVKTAVNETKNVYILTFSVAEFYKKNPEKVKEFEKGNFEVEEDIKFPQNATEAYELKRKAPITLKKGVYDIKIRGDIATVEIELK